MKNVFITLLLVFVFIKVQSQTTHTITTSSFTFSPADITIAVNDKVVFNTSASHPIVEVNQTTWNDNGNTALENGFVFPSGSGEITFTQEGIHFYVCDVHYSGGMKGKITVSNTTSLSLLPALNKATIYPNPLNVDILRVSLSQSVSVPVHAIIYDIVGNSRIKKSFKLNTNQLDIDCSELTSGLYIVQLSSLNRMSSIKFIKE